MLNMSQLADPKASGFCPSWSLSLLFFLPSDPFPPDSLFPLHLHYFECPAIFFLPPLFGPFFLFSSPLLNKKTVRFAYIFWTLLSQLCFALAAFICSRSFFFLLLFYVCIRRLYTAHIRTRALTFLSSNFLSNMSKVTGCGGVQMWFVFFFF